MKALRSTIFLLVCIGLIWLFVLLIMAAFRSSNTTSTTQPKQELASLAPTDAVAEMYVDGPVVLDEEHNALRISVDRTQSRIQVLKGYDGQIVDERVYPGSQEAFKSFLASLQTLGFSQGVVENDEAKELGACPSGSRYVFRLVEGNKVQRGWSTSCGGGTLVDQRSQIRALFIRQVPQDDYSDLTRGLRLNSL